MEVKDVWLKLNLDGIKLYFKVKGYKKSTDSNWDDEWCTVELNVQSENWLNYSQSGDLLLACEVEEILSLFEDLTEDKIPESFTKASNSARLLIEYVLCLRHNAFKDCAPDDKAVAARSAFLFG